MVARDAAGERARETREVRRRGRGCGREGAHPTHRHHTRGEEARSRTQHSVHEGRSAPAAAAWRDQRRGPAGPPPPPPHPTHPRREPARPGGPRSRAGETPGQATPGTADALSSARPSRPPQRGGGRRAARTRRPARGRGRPGGTRPALGRARQSGGGARRGGGGGVAGAPPRPSPRRRRQSGQRFGAAAGPGKRDTPGRGPGEQQMGSGPRRADGRTDGEGHRRGAATRDANATEPAVEAGVAAPPPRGGWLKTTRGKRVCRQGAPRDLTARGLPAQGRSRGTARTTDRPLRPHTHTRTPPPGGGETGAHPSRGLTPTATLHPEPRPARENTLPPRTGGPHSPHTRNPAVRQGFPRPAPLSGAPRALLHPGTAPADGGRETTPT